MGKFSQRTDASVHLLSGQEVTTLGVDVSQTRGAAFEVTSPGPPDVLSGNRGVAATFEILEVLKRMGIQAGPSQGLHVHVNVMGDAPGAALTTTQVAYVWAAYAHYQLVIDEFFHRVGLEIITPIGSSRASASQWVLQQGVPTIFAVATAGF